MKKTEIESRRASVELRRGEGSRGGGQAEALCPRVVSVVEGPGEGVFEPYITKLTVAERMDVEIRTVTRFMRRGVLRYYKVGPMVRFKWSEVESDLREHFQVCFDPKRPAGVGVPISETRYPRRAE